MAVMNTDTPTPVIGQATALVAGITRGQWCAVQEMVGWRSGRMTVVRAGDARVVTVDQTCEAEANVAFIAAAPQLVRDLLAEVSRLRAELGWPWPPTSGT